MIDLIVEALQYFYGGLWMGLGIVTTYGLIRLAWWNLRRSRWFKGKR